jgi:3-methyl-2-oxobutanoate hydroxymethyltransferase
MLGPMSDAASVEQPNPYGSGQAASAPGRRVRIPHLQAMKSEGRRWPMLTAYDMYSAQIFDEAGIPVLLVGDSAGNNVYGYDTTVPVTLDEMIPLVRAVSGAAKRAMIVADMPFGSYGGSLQQGFESAVRFMKEGRAHAVPLVDEARALEAAGAFAVVLEMVPAPVAARVTEVLTIPTIGIGAGPHTDAQVLVWSDFAGLRAGKAPRFVKKYADLRTTLLDAARAYAADVESGEFPSADHSFEE